MGPRLGGVFAVALGVRLLHIASLASAPVFGLRMGDGRIFHAWAQRLAGGDWVGSEVFFQAPLYPYFLGVVYAALGEDPRWLLGLQAVIGAASCAVVAAAGQRLFSPRAGLAAGLLLAVYPPVVFSDGLVQKSVLALFLVSLLLFVWAGVLARSGRPPRIREFGLLGLLLAGLVLSRENAGVLAVPILLWLLLEGTLSARRRLALLAALACGLALLLAPVAIRNRVVAGELVLTTSNLGPNLYMGNNERADGFYLALAEGRGSPSYEREDAVRLAQEALSRELSAREVSTYWTGRALDYIGSHPIQWTGLVLRKWLLLWNRREFADTEDLASHADWSPVLWGLAPFHFGVLAPLAALGAAVTWRQRRKLWSLYGMLAVYASSVVLFFVFARFRLPLIPFLVLFAGAGLVRLPELVRSRSRRQLTALAAGVIGVAVFCNWPVQTRAGAAVATRRRPEASPRQCGSRRARRLPTTTWPRPCSSRDDSGRRCPTSRRRRASRTICPMCAKACARTRRCWLRSRTKPPATAHAPTRSPAQPAPSLRPAALLRAGSRRLRVREASSPRPGASPGGPRCVGSPGGRWSSRGPRRCGSSAGPAPGSERPGADCARRSGRHHTSGRFRSGRASS
jgi:4-amino-4-deoxy-L-arabinose transferase-like glycosyltransferase